MNKYIKELTTQEQLKEAFPVLIQLRTNLTEALYLDLLQEMQIDGYKLFALYNNEKIVSVAGVYCKIKVQTSAKNLYRVLHYFCA